MDGTLPTFGRVEIGLADRSLPSIARELRTLAAQLNEIDRTAPTGTGPILAYHAIRATSAKLRGSN